MSMIHSLFTPDLNFGTFVETKGMKYLCVGALFRNESHSICEWIEHYKQQGAEHIYLLDDASDDDSLQKIQPYVDDGFVTCVTVQEPRYLGRQRNLYTHFLLPSVKAKDMQWLLVCDLDEYVWSPAYPTLAELLHNVHGCAQLQVNHTIFGSNGHETQPASVVAGFTRRSAEQPAVERRNTKYFVNSDYDFHHLNVHHATFASEDPAFKQAPLFMILGPEWLVMNHYSCQSRDFWRTVKCTRGDADNYWARTMDYFHETDQNDVEDTRLLERNRGIMEKVEKSKSKNPTV